MTLTQYIIVIWIVIVAIRWGWMMKCWDIEKKRGK